MQIAPSYDDVVSEVASFLEERLEFAVAQGIPEDLICLDPGIGFGKTPDQNLELVRRLDTILALGRPVLVGLSRKSTIGKVLGDPAARVGSDAASVGAAVAAFDRGASIFRVHEVRPHVEALAGRGCRGAGVRDDVKVELRGLELHGFHGVLPAEREHGQRFLVDVRLEPADGRAAESDDIADAVDYRDVVSIVSEISGEHAFLLLESLAAALAAALLERLRLAWVEVTVRKPDVVLELPVEHAAVTVERYAAIESE